MGVFVKREGNIDRIVGQNALVGDSFRHAPRHGIEAHGSAVHLFQAKFYMHLFEHLRRQQHAKAAGDEHWLAIAYAEGFHVVNSADQFRIDATEFDLGFSFKDWDQIFCGEASPGVLIEPLA